MKKGTKLTDNPKDYMLRVRLDNDTLNRLDELCEKHNTNRSVIVRMGIDKLYQDK
ncbi:ribbon-helix-helix protein, CopG family [Megamonas funiformis]|uniref:Ribbon-helix-helix protein, CopG family n=1 Tax=Megamonas funiformis TaxID=437897 RepID=A0AAW4U891_9FIRM|nr:ribbon-helix-helix protein, CopG family [Megamonas funiformis]MCB6829301.1 ribbon-helix-helix protein, CopG family [Megamonas funiformis]DAE88748.1 MAG TPA: Alginate and motility regulator [Caudoviricetes sp.]DAQ19496.1 MAG TPA: Alginate and motility regulator [Caudoviricetes sp.]DAZ65391.1 MAG TPA: Alginate and motility regulator [Caudoviricetes sp.]